MRKLNKKMAKAKIIEEELEIVSIKDGATLKVKKDENETIQERAVSLKSLDGTITLKISGKQHGHPLAYLTKPNDIGSKANLTLRLGPNPQKTLDETT